MVHFGLDLVAERRYDCGMDIDTVPNRSSPPAILLRESYREGGKVRKRTLLNITDWPSELIAGFRALLKGGTVIPEDRKAITITRSLPHGPVAAVLGTLRQIGLDHLLGPASRTGPQDKQAAGALRDSAVAKAKRSPSAVSKQTKGHTEDGVPVHSFQTMIADLMTLTRNTVVTALTPDDPFTITAKPTPIQQKAFNLLGVSIACSQ